MKAKTCWCVLSGTNACNTCVNSGDDYIQEQLPGIDWNEYLTDHEVDTNEKVNHPSHYNQGKYEVIDVIDDWKLSFELGNAIKYIARAGHKLDKVEDLKKAIWYIQREIDNENTTILKDYVEGNI